MRDIVLKKVNDRHYAVYIDDSLVYENIDKKSCTRFLKKNKKKFLKDNRRRLVTKS